jgi:VanZ family protein
MFLRYNLFSILWAILILVFTLMPGSQMPSVKFIVGFDKLAHVFVFAIQSLLLIVGFLKQYTFRFFRGNAVFMAISLSVIYGTLIELIQSFIPGRGMELGDLFADLAGSLLGWGLFYVLYKMDFS